MAIVATLVAWMLFRTRQLADAVMIYLLGIILVSMRFGYGPSIVAAVLSVLLLDFFFVSPHPSFSVSDFHHTVTFAVMFVVAVVISNLTRRVRLQADAARYRERRTASLYSMSRELAATRTRRDLRSVAVRHLHEMFEAYVAVLVEAAEGRLENLATGDGAFSPDEADRAVAEWVWSHDKPAGLSTDTLPSARALYTPLRGAQGGVGVLARHARGRAPLCRCRAARAARSVRQPDCLRARARTVGREPVGMMAAMVRPDPTRPQDFLELVERAKRGKLKLYIGFAGDAPDPVENVK